MVYRKFKKTYKKRNTRRTYRKRYYKRRMQRQIEYKDKELQITGGALTPGAPSTVLLNGVAVGTGFDSVIGRKFTMKQLQLRVNMTSAVDNLVRVMVVIDKDPNKAAFAITDLLTPSYTGDGYLNSLKVIEYAKRFWVLHDRTYKLEIMEAGDQDMRHIAINRRMAIPVQKGGDDATIGSITRNALYLIMIPKIGAASPGYSYYTGYSRLRYTDD